MHNKRPFDTTPYQGSRGSYLGSGGGGGVGADSKRSRPDQQGTSPGMYGERKLWSLTSVRQQEES